MLRISCLFLQTLSLLIKNSVTYHAWFSMIHTKILFLSFKCINSTHQTRPARANQWTSSSAPWRRSSPWGCGRPCTTWGSPPRSGPQSCRREAWSCWNTWGSSGCRNNILGSCYTEPSRSWLNLWKQKTTKCSSSNASVPISVLLDYSFQLEYYLLMKHAWDEMQREFSCKELYFLLLQQISLLKKKYC